jgi:hypothetical protein
MLVNCSCFAFRGLQRDERLHTGLITIAMNRMRRSEISDTTLIRRSLDSQSFAKTWPCMAAINCMLSSTIMSTASQLTRFGKLVTTRACACYARNPSATHGIAMCRVIRYQYYRLRRDVYEKLCATCCLVQRHSSCPSSAWEGGRSNLGNPKKSALVQPHRNTLKRKRATFNVNGWVDCDKVVGVHLAVECRFDHGSIGFAIACAAPPPTH